MDFVNTYTYILRVNIICNVDKLLLLNNFVNNKNIDTYYCFNRKVA